MGAGIHGGFGKTRGSCERHRIGHQVPSTEINLEMALNKNYYVETICQKYNVHLKSGNKSIQIVINPNLISSGRVVKSRPNIIELGPRAFVSEKELANTIAHELNHARSFLKGGNAPEKTAYTSGDTLEEYIRGKR